MLNTIWKVLTLGCQESTQLLSASLDRRLTWGERLAVKAHVFFCWSCRRFRRQIVFLREASRRHQFNLTTSMPDRSSSLIPEARERINEAIMREMHEESF